MTLQPASDHSLLVSFGNEISLAQHRRVHGLAQELFAHRAPFIRDLHPAYSSILVVFEPRLATWQQVAAHVRELAQSVAEVSLPASRVVEIPVCYDEEFSLDLQDVAEHNQLAREEVIALHTRGEYRVYFLGFTPGFAYLGGLSPRLFTPRLASPRKQVPAGSVAIGGQQAAVYPMCTPGGWRIIGRTPLPMFEAQKAEPALLALGDEVRFISISRAEFERAMARS
ncbi:MAG: 5-oxoprolinase subunit PxpB [candidate division KSB1 bacterium]